MGFFQQALQLVLHPYMQTGHLQLAAEPDAKFNVDVVATAKAMGCRKITLLMTPSNCNGFPSG